MSLLTDKTGATKGQAITEFILSLCIIAPLLLGAAQLFYSKWHRFRCAYQTFEATHQRRMGGTVFTQKIRFTKHPTKLEGQMICKKSQEKVRLLRLENL